MALIIMEVGVLSNMLAWQEVRRLKSLETMGGLRQRYSIEAYLSKEQYLQLTFIKTGI